MRRLLARCCFVLASCCSVAAVSQESPPPAVPKTLPTDVGFGENVLVRELEFPDASTYLARVDRRDAIDATPHRTIVWPTAHTPEKYTVSFSNFMLMLNQVAFSPTDDLQLSATFLIPSLIRDFQFGLAGKISVAKTPDNEISLQPLGKLRTGGSLPSSDIGVGLALLFDFAVSNDFVVTLGALGYATVWFQHEVTEYRDCETRSDWVFGECIETTKESVGLPRGGHFVGGQVAGTYYIFDSFSLRGELFTGVSAGSALGSEFAQTTEPFDYSQTVLQGPLAVGMPHDSKVTAGLGLAWSDGRFAVQFSGYVYRGILNPFSMIEAPREGFLLAPMLNLAVAI